MYRVSWIKSQRPYTGGMKNIILIITFLSSLPVFACADLKNKPSYFSQKKIDCGTLVHKIVEPTITIKGRKLPLALDLGDMWGECPDPNVSCYTPYINIKRRGNAICKAYGMGRYAKSTSWSPLLRSMPDEMGRLRRVNATTFAPSYVSINHSRSEYTYVRSIWCYPNYKK